MKERAQHPEMFSRDPNKFERVLAFQTLEEAILMMNKYCRIDEETAKSILESINTLGEIGYFNTEVDPNNPGTPEDTADIGIDITDEFLTERALVQKNRNTIQDLFSEIKYAQSNPEGFIDALYLSISSHIETGKHGGAIMFEYLLNNQMVPASEEVTQHALVQTFSYSSNSQLYRDFVSVLRTHDRQDTLSITEMRSLLPVMQNKGIDTSQTEDFIKYLEASK